MRKFNSVLMLLVIVGLAGCSSENPDSPVAKRKHVFKAMLASKEVLYKMASGQKPYDPKIATEQAKLLVSLSTKPWPWFAAETQATGKTSAKNNVWSQKALFQEKITRFEQEAQALAAVAGTTDFNTYKMAYRRLEDSCASCHKTFRDF